MKNKLIPHLRYCCLCGSRTKTNNITMYYNNVDKHYYCRKCNFDAYRFVDLNLTPETMIYINFNLNGSLITIAQNINEPILINTRLYPGVVEASSINEAFLFVKKILKNKDLL